jgi:electron transfer flavoprotein beta subunit
MEIIVCIKQVPGTSEVKMDEHGNLIRSGIEAKMNPFDLFALETAMVLKDKGQASKVKVISMGPPQAEAVIREAFWMGADEGTLMSDRMFAGADVWATSFTIAQGIRKIGLPELIICGKQTTDGDTAQVGAEMAEFLGIPHVTNVLRIIEIKEHSIIVDVDLPTVVQTIELQFPCLITVEKDIYVPRLPSFKKKIATKDRKIQKLGFTDLADKNEYHYGMKGSPTKVQRVFPPEVNKNHLIWEKPENESTQMLLKLLEEKKVI